MLIAARNAMLAGAALPYDAEVEYLQSTGTQYIDTGIVIAGSDIEMALDVAYPNTIGYKYSMGFNESTSNRLFFRPNRTASTTQYVYAYNTNKSRATNSSRHLWDVKISSGNVDFARDGESFGTATDVIVLPTNFSVYLFAVNGGSVNYASCSIYGAKITLGGVDAWDGIPVRVGSGADAVGYMYDRVSGTLFGNAGTGAFVIGPDK